MGLRHFSISHIFFKFIIDLHLARHLEYIEMLNDARVASLGFFKDNICTTRINKEKKFKIKFQVLLKFAQILPDYIALSYLSCNFYSVTFEFRVTTCFFVKKLLTWFIICHLFTPINPVVTLLPCDFIGSV